MAESKKTKAELAEELHALRQRIDELEAGQHRFAFLAEASTILAASLDYNATLRSVAQLAVPRVADWCGVDLLAADGSVERLAVAHVDPAKVAWVYQIQQRYPPSRDALSGLYNVLRTGKTEFYPEVSEAMLVASARDAEHLQIIRELAFTSAIIVPLLARGRILGAITLVSAESGRRYGPEDLALAEAFASCAALEIDNARLYNEASDQREQLAAILRGVTDGITVQDQSQRLIYANDIAARICGFPNAEALLQAPQAEMLRQFAIMDEAGQPFPLGQLPGRLILQGQTAQPQILRFKAADGGQERWSIVQATPIRGVNGQIAFAVNTFHDITAIKQAEAALREQRELLDVTLRSIGDGVITTDAQGAVTFMNEVAETLTGWSTAQAHGHDLAQVFHIINEHTRQPVENPAARVIREGMVLGLANHTILIAADGTERPIDDSGAPIRNADGELIGVVLVFRDITERKQAEDTLRTSELRYRTLVEAPPLIIWTLTPEGTVNYLNQRWSSYTGLSRDQTSWLQALHPSEQAYVEEIRTRAIAAGQGYEIEVRLRRYDDSYRWHLVRVAPIYNDGQLLSWIGTASNIHDIKQAEVAQRFLAEVSRELASSLDYPTTLRNTARLAVPSIADWCSIHILEPDGLIHRLAVAHADPEREALALAQPEHFALSAQDHSILAQTLRSGQAALYANFSESPTAESAEHEQFMQLRALGLQSAICVPLRISERTLGAITLALAGWDRRYSQADLGLAQDLAQRAALAIEHARLYHAAQEAIHVRDQFLSIASHELKTPLTTLWGNAQMLQRRATQAATLADRDLRALQVITSQASRLNKMIAGMLDISRIETGQLSIEHTRLDLTALARRVVDETRLGLHQHSLDYEEPDGTLYVDGDEMRLEQVLQNLLQNAIKYSLSGGSILVRLEKHESLASLSVMDQGIGIPATELAHLFQRFYRAANVTEQHISGLGVGLYVVKEIVALHGGSVSATSEEGRGSTFTIFLPLATDGE